ncbi:MAG: hypothetical protein QOJ81_1489 [Chloroflexota bacterium]|jgi:hypothetical protein|nr:hypothetical protein [Chloroflexota bacterium]
MNELESHGDIAVRAERLLRSAGALGRLPTPVDDIVAAAKLVEPEESLLSEGMIKQAPAHIAQKILGFANRIRGLVDRRALEVHLAPDVTHEGRRRFIRLHEVMHHVLPWQEELGYVDDDRSLSAATDEMFELEASDGAAELLFQGQGFARDAAELEIGLPAVIAGHERYGSSVRAALWRFPQAHRAAVMSVVLDRSPLTINPLRYKRHELNMSPSFARRFGASRWAGSLWVERYPFLAAAAATVSASTVVSDECTFVDDAGEVATLRVDALDTGYNILVLVWVPIHELTRKRVRLVA